MKRKIYIKIIILAVIYIAVIIIGAYFAPDDRLSDILLTIFSTILGGVIAYYGVVKTIQHGTEERIISEQKHEEERKEEERKKVVPYLKVVDCDCPDDKVKVNIYKQLDLSKEEDLTKIQNGNYFGIKIQDFCVKNITDSVIIPEGITIDNDDYEFINKVLIEKSNVCQIQLSINGAIKMASEIKRIILFVRDILGNRYKLNCSFLLAQESFVVEENINNTIYRCWLSTCMVNGVSLPELSKEV